ncbi:TIGR02266 family protein [Archangium lansingense]|uniref:TIGR02266 family protein n=1 Tax=Archangium lansingense TaxID=2995310 RepID=A0ABT4AIJ3_9BACT|nr:TIGR02266 family protein [Archangium lansinium]MCY1081511.1 TIGR02266 family protein [Archangium lansinium]
MSTNYWIGDSIGRVLGPLTLQSLRELIGSGRLKAVTRASRDGSSWEPIEHFNEVKDLLGALKANPAAEVQQAERLRQQVRQMQGLPAHQLFGVKPDAPMEELRGAFFRLAKRYSPEHQGPDTHPELRKAHAEVFELLARRMREAEAQQAPARAPNAAARPGQQQQAQGYTYSAEEFVGLQQTRNDRLQVDVKVSTRTAGIFTDHRIINLQSGGLFIPTDKPLRLGMRVDLVLNFEQQQRQIKLRSSVIWEYTLDDGKQPRGYGLGLADLRPEERSFIDEFLRGNRTGAPTTSR